MAYALATEDTEDTESTESTEKVTGSRVSVLSVSSVAKIKICVTPLYVESGSYLFIQRLRTLKRKVAGTRRACFVLPPGDH